MPNIQILTEDVRNLIAAGEVVSRPASAVKELVENSIDAGACEIRIEVLKGGLEKIETTDDGCGMCAEDLRLSIARHATSKLRGPDDLSDIRTMGFRGEALPSIAQVSKMKIESRPKESDQLSGHVIEIDGGVVKSFKETGSAIGTRVTVSDIFYNVPARKKFARTPRTELGHVKDAIQRLALANPSIRFQLISDGKEVISAFSLNDQKQRTSEILGSDIVKGCYQLNADAGEVRVYGLIGDPAIAKEGSRGLYWFVNRRPIRDRLLNHAVSQAYRSLLPKGYNPFSILFITLSSDLVDINVHPTKSEVKFLKGNAVHDFVVNAVRKTLGKSSGRQPEERWRSEELCRPEERSGRQPEERSGRPLWRPEDMAGTEAGHYTPAISNDPAVIARSEATKQSPSHHAFNKRDTRYACPEGFDRVSAEVPSRREIRDTTLHPIGQLHNTYILCENTNGSLVIIDQHAAHERIGYEKLKRDYAKSDIHSQRLLIPDVITVPSKTVGYLESALEDLNKIGWEIEYFGGDNFCVKAVPAILGNINLKTVINAVAEDLSEAKKIDSHEDKIDYIMKVSACHAQIRAGDRLEMPEIRHLLKEIDQPNNWGQSPNVRCPHGRPAVVEITLGEIGKWFKR